MADKDLALQKLQEQVKSLQAQVKYLEEQLKDKDKKVSESQLENEPQPENESQPENEPEPEKDPQPQPQQVEPPLIRGMDTANARAAKILFTRGNQAFVDHVFTDQETDRKLSYAEMRMRYG